MFAVQKQAARVEEALARTSYAGVPVHPALCFVEARISIFAKPFSMYGVYVTWREHLVPPMVAQGVLTERQGQDVARLLAAAFPPAQPT